jgi:hypothetical protein
MYNLDTNYEVRRKTLLELGGNPEGLDTLFEVNREINEIVENGGCSGGESLPTQHKTVEYNERGNYDIYPDSGYLIDSVSVVVNTPEILSNLSLSYTSNGNYNVSLSSQCVSKLNINVSVPTLSVNNTSLYFSSNGSNYVSMPTGTCKTQFYVYVSVPTLSPNNSSLSFTSNGSHYVSMPTGACKTQFYVNVSVPSTTFINNHIINISSNGSSFVSMPYGMGLSQFFISANVPTLQYTMISGLKLGYSTFTNIPVCNSATNSAVGEIYKNPDKSEFFKSCKQLVRVSLSSNNWYNFDSNWGTTTTLSHCFEDCSGLQGFDCWCSFVYMRNANYMFKNCHTMTYCYINGDFHNANCLQGCYSVENMFENCYNLSEVVLNGLSNCTNFNNMFLNCSSLEYIAFNGESADYAPLNSLTKIDRVDMGLSTCPNVSNIRGLYYYLPDRTTVTANNGIFVVGPAHIAKLTEEEKQKFTAKGWVLE